MSYQREFCGAGPRHQLGVIAGSIDVLERVLFHFLFVLWIISKFIRQQDRASPGFVRIVASGHHIFPSLVLDTRQ